MSTGIEWTDETWNPIAGCQKVSPGCTHCYAELMAQRIVAMGTTRKYDDAVDAKGWTGRLAIDEDALQLPRRWRKPRTVFVNSMSDLFWDQVPDALVDRVFAVMGLYSQHRYQVLTKRAEGMMRWASEVQDCGDHVRFPSGLVLSPGAWPLPNVALGVSVETQMYMNRLRNLTHTAAALRFVSAEPLLGPLALELHLRPRKPDQIIIGCESRRGVHLGRLGARDGQRVYPSSRAAKVETSPKTWLGWAEDIVSQCATAGVGVFVKQIPSLDGRLCKAKHFDREQNDWPEALRRWDLLPWKETS